MMSRKRRGFPAALILLAFLSCVLAAREPTKQDTPRPKIDYVAKLNELVKKGSDESQNAELFYQKAFELCVEPPADVEIRVWPADLSSERRSLLRKWVDANVDALSQLRLGTQRPSYWWEYRGRSIWDRDELFPLSKPRILFFALTLRMKFEAARGDVNGAIEDLLASYRFGLDIKKRLLPWEQLVGIAILGGTCQAGFQIIDRAPVSADLLESLQRRLTDLAHDQDLLINLRYNEIAQLDGIQKVYGGWPEKLDMKAIDEMGGVALDQMASQLSAMMGTNLTPAQVRSSMFNYSRDELVRLVREGQVYYEPLVLKTPFQWKREGIDVEKKWRDFTGGNLLLEIMAPAVQNMSEMSFRCQVHRDALITTLALLRWRDDRGGFPEDLDELASAGYLTEVPMDPYSDRPLSYRRRGNAFVLYSFGADLKDNGGIHDPKWGHSERGGDYVFWPVQNEPAKE